MPLSTTTDLVHEKYFFPRNIFLFLGDRYAGRVHADSTPHAWFLQPLLGVLVSRRDKRAVPRIEMYDSIEILTTARVFAGVLLHGGRPKKVLARYPPEAILPCENVADYCFPQGVRAARIDARESQSSLNKVLFQPGACQRGSQSFVFMFSGIGDIHTLCDSRLPALQRDEAPPAAIVIHKSPTLSDALCLHLIGLFERPGRELSGMAFYRSSYLFGPLGVSYLPTPGIRRDDCHHLICKRFESMETHGDALPPRREFVKVVDQV